MKSYSIGVMQGRLLPKYEGRYQAHPIGYWQREFPIAAKLGLDTIEFILDYNDVDQNPLMNESGIEEIQRLSEDTGVAVKSVCADYLMEAPLHSLFNSVVIRSRNILSTLIKNASKIGVSDIVIPCIEKSALSDGRALNLLCENIKPALEIAEKCSVNLALETDLSPRPFADFIERLDSMRITVNYDTGNSASLGYAPAEELAVYGTRISDIHIKDRLRDGSSVVLGNGATDFDRFFSALAKTGYSGLFIMQAYRDDEGVEIFQKQLEWIKPKLKEWSLTKDLI